MTVSLPHATRSQIFGNLWNLVKTIPPPEGMSWKVKSQHIKSWDDIPDQPAIFLNRASQTATQKHAYGATRWEFKAQIWVYYRIDSLNCAGNDEFPEQIVDGLLDNIEQTFQTNPTLGSLNLNGTVVHCWIDGAIVFDSGIIDNQAIVVVPLSILV